MSCELLKKLNIKITSPYWEEAYEKALKEPAVPEWLTESYLRGLHEEYGIFPQNLELLVEAAGKVAENEDLCMFAKVLHNIIGPHAGSGKAFPEFELPVAPQDTEDVLAYDMVSVFPVIAHIRPSWEGLTERGVEADILKVRFSMIDEWLTNIIKTQGRPSWGKTHFLYYRVFVYVSELRIGRLRFEWVEHSPYPVKAFVNEEGEMRLMMDDVTLHRSGHVLGTYGFADEEGSFYAKVSETEEEYEGYVVDEETHLAQDYPTKLLKKEWKLAFQAGDSIIKVHVAPGSGFTKEECDKSFARAREIFDRCFPEYDFKGFLTHTWFLGPALEPILKEGSNLKNFRKYFTIFPAKSNAQDALMYVYGLHVKNPSEVAIDELPEDNSLKKGLKEQLKKGEYVYEFNGFFLW